MSAIIDESGEVRLELKVGDTDSHISDMELVFAQCPSGLELQGYVTLSLAKLKGRSKAVLTVVRFHPWGPIFLKRVEFESFPGQPYPAMALHQKEDDLPHRETMHYVVTECKMGEQEGVKAIALQARLVWPSREALFHT